MASSDGENKERVCNTDEQYPCPAVLSTPLPVQARMAITATTGEGDVVLWMSSTDEVLAALAKALGCSQRLLEVLFGGNAIQPGESCEDHGFEAPAPLSRHRPPRDLLLSSLRLEDGARISVTIHVVSPEEGEKARSLRATPTRASMRTRPPSLPPRVPSTCRPLPLTHCSA
jgi:hypothetical protein